MDMTLHVVHDAETHRDLDAATVVDQPARSAPVGKKPTFATAWYHDAAIEEARRDAVEANANPYSAVNLPRH